MRELARIIGLAALVSVTPSISRCDTLTFTVPQNDLGISFQYPDHVDFSSSALNGTVLSGQALSLDLVFADNVLARLTVNDMSLAVTLDLQTNASTFPGFAGTTTGYFLDASGNQLGSTLVAGRGDDSGGSTFFGLVNFSAADLAGQINSDTSGVHFDTVLPNSGYVITNADFGYGFLSSSSDRVEFGTAQELPEPSSVTLTLIGAGLLAVLAKKRLYRGSFSGSDPPNFSRSPAKQ